jgi:Ca2+-binding EF-hand superfamily protein
MEAIITIIYPLCVLLNIYVMILDAYYPKKPLYLYYSLISHAGRNKAPDREVAQVDIKDVRINRDELMLAIETMVQPPTKEGEQIDDCMGYEEFNALFQESEPGLDEVKEAFSVFDQNRDGLVDARDLQRVLTNLGLREGTYLEACERMIAQHDRNGDGSVDLIDFSRLLEMCLLENGD